ncbi:MAG: hypothetical protein CR971_00545 [candidate division SR1 bacterium]|nr:MAG: hypothetical protein CR971_00545 [candidate division SR1 bacterium]
MPHRLKVRQEKIQNKRRQTPWREFVKEIASWIPVNLYKVNGDITRYPETKRKIGKLVSLSEFAGKRDNNIREDIPTDGLMNKQKMLCILMYVLGE